MMLPGGEGYASEYTESMKNMQMERLMNKLNHWDYMRHQTYQKRADDRYSMEQKVQKKEIKIGKVAKNHEEEIKNRLERLNAHKEKWSIRVDAHHN